MVGTIARHVQAHFLRSAPGLLRHNPPRRRGFSVRAAEGIE
jgi:hypothetical protein